MAQKPYIAPIPGTRKIERLEENLKSSDVLLTYEEVKQIDAEIEKIEISGARYPKELQARIGK